MNTLKDIIGMGGGLFEEAYNTGRRDALRETGAEDLQATVTALEAANKVLGEKLEKAQARIEELETIREKEAGRKPCAHGNVCRAYMKERRTILRQSCPSGCEFYKPKEVSDGLDQS